MPVRFDEIQVGDQLPQLVQPPLDRVRIAMYAGASGDFNPIHLDDEQARANRLPGVIAHGMLPMAFLAQLLTGWAPRQALQSLSTRFTAMAFPGDVLTCRGVVTAKAEEAGQGRVEVELTVVNQRDEPLLAGSARLVFS
jgi:acyl dehydratase